MKKFILGILFGILIAGSVVYILRQQDNEKEQSVKQNSSNALSKIRRMQQKPQSNSQEKLQKFATDLTQAKSPKDMIKAIDEIIKIRPQDANLYALKSQILQQQGDYKGAVEAINKAISLDPQNANYYRIRAEQEFAAQDFVKAERDFTAAAQLSGNADNYYNRAITNLNLGNYTAANQDFKKAQTLYKKEGNLPAAIQAQNVSKMLTQNMPKQSATPQTKKTENTKKSQTENKNTQAINDAITSKISQSLKQFSQSETLKEFQDLLPQGDKALPSLEDLLNHQDIKPKITKKDVVQGTALESLSKAKQLIAKKDFEGAKQVLDKAIQDFPKDDSLVYNRA
nr:tetratricopeptide repeat protein [Elusimicrobiaceae bacterium]